METRRATHPSAEVLKAFGLSKLDDASTGAVMAHLDGCAGCRQIVAAQSGDDFLQRFRQTRAPRSTLAPAKALAGVAPAPQPSAIQTTVWNLPPELADHPQYEVVRELGRGGMGVVYLAKNKLMDRLEVLKVVNKALLDRSGAVERFLREIRSAAKLNHPNVVAAYSALQIGELLAFAMEYVEGEDLAVLVHSRGPLPVAHACHYVQQAAIGLQHAFEKGMVHRDIKPQNLILAREGKKHIVKVLDFGLAKATREKAEDTGLTGEGQMLGTPDYIAPEQTVDAASADIRADIYSLGCTLYYLLTGAPPFRAKSLGAILLAHQSTEAPPLNIVRPEVPVELATVVRKMMAKSPAQRYQTPTEVAQALAAAGKSAAKGTPAKSSTHVPAPAARRPEDEKRLLRAETIAPGAARATMVGNVATPGAAGDILSAGTILPVEARRTKSGRKRRSAARKTWLVGAAAAAGLLLGLLGLWAGGVFKVKTANGTIVLENVPADAEVLVDGATVTVKGGDGKTVTIDITPGKKHQLRVKKEGFKVFGEEVEIDAGDRRAIRVRLQPESTTAKAPPAPVEQPRNPSPVPLEQPRNPSPDPKTQPQNPAPVPETPPQNPAPADDKGFVSLFNGKNLTNWKTHPTQPGGWAVEDGCLVGRSATANHLFSTRGDYEDFHLRAEVRINKFGNSGIYFRGRFGLDRGPFPAGYEAQILHSYPRPNVPLTGSLQGLSNVVKSLVQPDEWFKMDVIAEGNHIVIKVNGDVTADFLDKANTYRKGHLVLQAMSNTTVNITTIVQFRKIEIKELPGSPPGAPAPEAPARPAQSGLPPEAKAAAKAFEKSCADAREKLLAEFDTAVDRLAKIKGSTELRLKLIEAVKEEKKRFENGGLIPWSEPMRPFLAKYFASTSVAESKVHRVYNSLIVAQLQAKNESMIADLRADLTNLVGVRLLARWRVIRDGRPPGYLVSLYSNGRINNSNGTWIYSTGVLIYRWPDPKAPGGAWLDTSNVSADGTAYAGTNNATPRLRSKFTGVYAKPD